MVSVAVAVAVAKKERVIVSVYKLVELTDQTPLVEDNGPIEPTTKRRRPYQSGRGVLHPTEFSYSPWAVCRGKNPNVGDQFPETYAKNCAVDLFDH